MAVDLPLSAVRAPPEGHSATGSPTDLIIPTIDGISEESVEIAEDLSGTLPGISPANVLGSPEDSVAITEALHTAIKCGSSTPNESFKMTDAQVDELLFGNDFFDFLDSDNDAPLLKTADS